MTVPTELTTRVYAAFGHDWTESLSLSDYTEITDYVMSVNTAWGRRSWFDEYRAETATIVLRDPDRRFEPEWASGAYYPDVIPRVPIFVMLDTGPTNSLRVYAGYIDSWRTRYLKGDARGTVTVRAVGAFAVLARQHVDMTVTGDTGDEMVADILDDIGWPTNHRSLGTGFSTLQSYTVDTNALAALQLIARSEGGSVSTYPYAINHGFGPEKVGPWIRWSPRYSSSGQSAAASYGFSDDWTGDSARPYRAETIFEYDVGTVFNRAEVTRIGGAPQTHTDATSVDAYGERTKTRSGLLLATDAECDDYAHYIVSRHKDPARHITIETQLAVGGNAWENIGNPLQKTGVVAWLKRRPQGGAAFTDYVVIDGGRYRHRRGGPVRLTFYARPYQWYQWWTLDSDLSSQLEETTRLGW